MFIPIGLLHGYLDLGGIWKDEWNCYIKGLTHGGIILSEVQESFLWMHNKVNGEVTAILAYDLIVSTKLPLSPIKTHSHIWEYDIPLKIK